MEHLPTIEAGIRYWEAVRVQAIRSRDQALEWTALGLRRSYEAARIELTEAKRRLAQTGRIKMTTCSADGF